MANGYGSGGSILPDWLGQSGFFGGPENVPDWLRQPTTGYQTPEAPQGLLGGMPPSPNQQPIDVTTTGAAVNRNLPAGVDPTYLETVMRIESGGNPRAVTGSYKGLFQLSDAEFRKYGPPGGNIFDPAANRQAFVNKTQAEQQDLTQRLGRPPTPQETYLAHQQGVGGAPAHLANPDVPAWRNMASTAEGRQKGDAWAKQAIWGNIPDQLKRQFGSVDNVTSRQFVDLWRARYDRGAARVAGGGGDSGIPAGAQYVAGSLPAGGVPEPPAGQGGPLPQAPTQMAQAATPGPGDRLMAGIQGFANSPALFPAIGNLISGLATGQRSDPYGILEQQRRSVQQYVAQDPSLDARTKAVLIQNPGLATEYLKSVLKPEYMTVKPEETVYRKPAFGGGGGMPGVGGASGAAPVPVIAGGPKFENVSQLRTQFESQPNYKRYQDAIGPYQSMLRSAKVSSPTSDVDLITGFAKILDPVSSVREGEYNTIAASQSIPERLKGLLLHVLEGKGKLSPETIVQLMETARSRTEGYRGQAMTDAERYKGIATANKFDPSQVVVDIPEVPRYRLPGLPQDTFGQRFNPPAATGGFSARRIP